MNYGFTLDPGETINRVVHRSLISLLPTTGMAILLALLAVGLTYLHIHSPDTLHFSIHTILILILVSLFLASIIFPMGLYIYQYNVLVFTNVHLIEVEQNGLFGRSISTVSYDHIQDVNGTSSGFFQSIFGYGSVQVQSAGTEENFIFKYASNPDDLADDVVKLAPNVADSSLGSPEA
jgi:uncharacterized membrane protein YdbT with pleckstrin-like domain